MAGLASNSLKKSTETIANDKYVVIQATVTEKLMSGGSNSGIANLKNLQRVINEQAAKGYRLHTITTTTSATQGGLMGGDKVPTTVQATMVFERLN